MFQSVPPGGIERTEAELLVLLASAGYELTRVLPKQSPLNLSEAQLRQAT